MDFEININDSVNGVIRQIIDLYCINEKADKAKMKHKEYTDGKKKKFTKGGDIFSFPQKYYNNFQ